MNKKVIEVTADTIVVRKGDLVEHYYNDVLSHSYVDSTYVIYLLIIVCLILCFLCAVVFFSRRIRSLKHLREDIERMTSLNKDNVEAIRLLIEDRVQLIRSLLKTKASDDKQEKKPLLDYLDYLQTVNEQYHQIIDAFKEDRVFFHKLERAIDSGYDDVISKIRRRYGDTFKEIDYTIIVGTIAGLSSVCISFMTDLKPGTVRVRKSRILEKMKRNSDDFLRYISPDKSL